MSNPEMSEKLCTCFIGWCEHRGQLNSECGLSTIEWLRQTSPKKALEYINEVMTRHRDKLWKMPKLNDKKLQFIGE